MTIHHSFSRLLAGGTAAQFEGNEGPFVSRDKGPPAKRREKGYGDENGAGRESYQALKSGNKKKPGNGQQLVIDHSFEFWRDCAG